MTKRSKNGLIIGVLFALAFAAIFGIFAKFNAMETSKKLLVTNYDIGICSTVDGKVGESNQNIVLKSLYKVNGAEVSLEDGATVSVKVFYYDEDKNFIEAQTDLDMATNAPADAVYFRIMITPAEIDGEPAPVTLLNIGRYTSQVRVVVAK